MTGFISFLLTIAQLLMTVFAPLSAVKAPEDTSGFEPVIRFEVMSDTHVQTLGDIRSRRIQKAISIAYDDAAKDDNYKNFDAVIFAGDLTDGGKTSQFIAFRAAVNSVLKENTKLITLMHKGHDSSAMGKDKALAFESQIMNQPTDQNNVINGYHFISISVAPGTDDNYTPEQRIWLKNCLDEAVAEDPSKPVFVFHHEHVSGTVYGGLDGDGWGMDYFKDIFEQYPQIVHFSGHSHYPANDPRSIYQGDFTAVGTGGIYYMEFTVDGKNQIHPDGNHDCGQAWITEVDKENRVRLRAFDVNSGNVLCEYILDNLTDKNDRDYPQEKLRSAASSPVFPSDAQIRVKSVGIDRYKVTVPVAKPTDGMIVFLYRIFVYSANGELKETAYSIADYWKSGSNAEDVSFRISAEKGDTVKITAENAYGMASDALTFNVNK